MNYYYSKSNSSLFKSLEKFFYFTLNEDLNNVLGLGESTSKKMILFIYEDEKVNDPFLDIFKKNTFDRIVVLGKKQIYCPSYINLFDFDHLEKNIILNLHKKSSLSSLLYVQDIGSKLKQFFKGHGENSLLSGLNAVIYYLGNAPKLIQKKLCSWEDCENFYIKPGLKNWIIFKQRFVKYKDYLELLGFEGKTQLIENLIKDFQKFIDEMSPPNEDKLLFLGNSYIQRQIKNAKEIQTELEKIKNELNIEG